MALTWPAVVRSAWARSFSAKGQRRMRNALCRGARLLLGQADRGELRVGVGDARDRRVVSTRTGRRNSALRITRPAW